MTVDERVTRLERAVTSFVKSSTEFQVEIMRLVRANTALLRNHNQILHHHAERIDRLDEMVTRFDAWLRGQGPANGNKKRKK